MIFDSEVGKKEVRWFPRTVWLKVVKFGTLVGVPKLTLPIKFHICTSRTLAPPTDQIRRQIHTFERCKGNLKMRYSWSCLMYSVKSVSTIGLGFCFVVFFK